MFVSERALTAEKDHVEGFAPEVSRSHLDQASAGNALRLEGFVANPHSPTVCALLWFHRSTLLHRVCV